MGHIKLCPSVFVIAYSTSSNAKKTSGIRDNVSGHGQAEYVDEY